MTKGGRTLFLASESEGSWPSALKRGRVSTHTALTTSAREQWMEDLLRTVGETERDSGIGKAKSKIEGSSKRDELVRALFCLERDADTRPESAKMCTARRVYLHISSGQVTGIICSEISRGCLQMFSAGRGSQYLPMCSE